MELDAKQFIRDRVSVDEASGCWLWTLSVNNWGYGRTRDPLFRERAAHRISYAAHFGRIPIGMNVLHKCDTPRCCNPDHLFLGTHDDNTKDMMSKGRQSRLFGSMSGTAKLTEPDVLSIRSDNENTITDIAKRFGVSRRAVRFVKTGVTWKHVK